MNETQLNSFVIPYSKFPKAAELDHCWVARTWLNDLGLSQHSLAFEGERVDARVLSTLTKRDLEKYLKVTRKFHQASLLHGIELLRMVKFNKAVRTFIQFIRIEFTQSQSIVWVNSASKKFCLMGFVYRVLWSLKALWIVLVWNHQYFEKFGIF